MKYLHIIVLAVLVGVSGCSPNNDNATMVITDAKIWTGDDSNPIAEAIALKDNRVLAVGSNEQVTAFVGSSTTQLRSPGELIVPGFVDSHVHLLTGGLHLASVQLRDAGTRDEFVSRIAEFAASVPPGEWITGGDWDHENWGGELPTREWIDGVTPDNPVWINRLDGHMALANSIALSTANVSAATADVVGGEIVRDAAGRPTGILKDNAMGLVDSVVPAHSPEHLHASLLAAMQYLNEQGVTSVHDMSGEPGSYTALQELHDQSRLTVRVYEAMPLRRWRMVDSLIQRHGRGDDFLRIGGLKAFMDGSLGSHTAAFFEPFTDAPDDRGILVSDLDKLAQAATGADSAGLQLFVHAIGDSAIASLLDIFESVASANGIRDRRPRIEHAQHIRPSDVPRFARDGVIASMQPYHAIDDGRWAEKVIGAERIKTTYAFRSLLDSGARMAFGSDWFVAPPTPIEGIYAAVARQTLDGANPQGWVPEQKISVEDALRAYTAGASYAGFTESSTGKLKEGYLADFVVLSEDILNIDSDRIVETEVLMTVVDGTIVYKKPDIPIN